MVLTRDQPRSYGFWGYASHSWSFLLIITTKLSHSTPTMPNMIIYFLPVWKGLWNDSVGEWTPQCFVLPTTYAHAPWTFAMLESSVHTDSRIVDAILSLLNTSYIP